MDILFEHITAVTMDEPGTVLTDAYVGVANGSISYIGSTPPKDKPRRVISGARKILMPGLCNAHVHSPMTLLRGYADDYDLQTWLFGHILPAENRMTDEAVYWGARLAMMEMIAGGTVSFTDMYDHMLAVGRAADESGLKANLTRALLCDGPEYSFKTDPRAAETRELIDMYHNRDGGRLKVDVSIHAEYTSNRALWEAAAGFAAERGLGMNIHLSETRREHEECKDRHNRQTPARVMYRAGVFDVRTTAAHCVWLENDDVEMLGEKGVSVAHCPVSNAKLASGAANVPLLLERGVNVALGTDGTASNNSLDLFGEMKTAALVGKLTRRDPEAADALTVLRMAATGGFISQGRADSGRIAEGFSADLIMLDFDKPHLTPCHNVVSHLVYAARASDVCLTMARGHILYENGGFLTLDAERTMAETRLAAKRLAEG